MPQTLTFLCARMTDWFLPRRVRVTVAMLGCVGPPQPSHFFKQKAQLPQHLSVPPPSLSGSSGSAPVLGSCIHFFLIALSGTPGNASDCYKSLDWCLFELSGIHLNLNVFISWIAGFKANTWNKCLSVGFIFLSLANVNKQFFCVAEDAVLYLKIVMLQRQWCTFTLKYLGRIKKQN